MVRLFLSFWDRQPHQKNEQPTNKKDFYNKIFCLANFFPEKKQKSGVFQPFCE